MAFVDVIAIINIHNSLNKNCVLAPNVSRPPMDQKHLLNYSHLSEDYNMIFKQFSVLKTKGLVFKTTG